MEGDFHLEGGLGRGDAGECDSADRDWGGGIGDEDGRRTYGEGIFGACDSLPHGGERCCAFKSDADGAARTGKDLGVGGELEGTSVQFPLLSFVAGEVT